MKGEEGCEKKRRKRNESERRREQGKGEKEGGGRTCSEHRWEDKMVGSISNLLSTK
jgi:hypothetical protein